MRKMTRREIVIGGASLAPFWAVWRRRWPHPHPPPPTTTTTRPATTSTSTTSSSTSTTRPATTSPATTAATTTTRAATTTTATSTSTTSTSTTRPAGLALFLDYDWTGPTPLEDWNVFDGKASDNGELTASSPANATIVADPSASGGVFLRLAVTNAPYAGYPLTGVEMDNFYSGPGPGRGQPGNLHRGFGQGQPFSLECRMRYTGGSGAWVGWWAVDIDGLNAELDGMETVNNRGPRYALHSPEVGPASYGPDNDGGWHVYRADITAAGVDLQMDGALRAHLPASVGQALMNANMGLRLKAACGGTYPDGDAGTTTPIAGTPFPQHTDIDYYRAFR